MLAGKKLTDFTSFVSLYDFKKYDDIIMSYFKDEWMQFYWNWQNKPDWSNKIQIKSNNHAVKN